MKALRVAMCRLGSKNPTTTEIAMMANNAEAEISKIFIYAICSRVELEADSDFGRYGQ